MTPDRVAHPARSGDRAGSPRTKRRRQRAGNGFSATNQSVREPGYDLEPAVNRGYTGIRSLHRAIGQTRRRSADGIVWRQEGGLAMHRTSRISRAATGFCGTVFAIPPEDRGASGRGRGGHAGGDAGRGWADQRAEPADHGAGPDGGRTGRAGRTAALADSSWAYTATDLRLVVPMIPGCRSRTPSSASPSAAAGPSRGGLALPRDAGEILAAG